MGAKDDADTIALIFKQVQLAHGYGKTGRLAREPDLARKAILKLPSIDDQLTDVHTPSNTILQVVVGYATSEHESDLGWRKGSGSALAHARKHLALASKLVGAALANLYEPKLRKRLSRDALKVLEAVIPARHAISAKRSTR